MAFFQLVLKANKVDKARQIYEDEKMKSIEISKGAKVHYTFRQKWRHKKILCKMKMKAWCDKLISCPEDTWCHKKAVLLRTDGTFENYILKSVVGFLGGMFLTYLFFVFFVWQLNFTLSSATMLCSIFGIVLTIGLAFSYRVRCIVFLLLPQFFSKRGRQALMAYAFILAVTGPAKNTLHNIGVLSESLACGQEQLKMAVKAIVDMIKQPFYALRDSIAKVVRVMKSVVRKIKETLLAMKRIVLSILRVFKSVFQWLGSVINICNKKLGTPYDRCQRVFEGAVQDCKASLGPIFGGICNLVYIVGLLCLTVKPWDIICMLVSYIADTIIDTVRRKLRKFTKHMRMMFYVKVKFSHSFQFETNQSKSMNEISTGIVTEIRSRTDKFLTVFDWMSFATSFFFMFMFLRVIHYRNKWLTNERFDNRYLTEDLREIDLRRVRKGKETVLPLNPREKNKYIPLTSITLIKSEKIRLTKSTVFLFLATFKLCIHMMADYSLYWVLSTIRYHGRFETKVQQSNSVGIYVSGNGYLAELYRSIVRSFSPAGEEMEMDSMPCLPDPIPPDLDRYVQIFSLIFFCWIMAIFEPYGLRLRQVVMAHYHPDRAKQRAVWLYNHIIRSRSSFLKFARRQLRRKFTLSHKDSVEQVTLRERFGALCPVLNRLCPQKQNMCLLCGAVERDGQPPHIKCPTPGCVGLFCIQCFADLQNLCTICLTPLDYGDLSDMSEEKDSSDDQLPIAKLPKLKDKLGTVEEGEEDEEEDAEEEEDEEDDDEDDDDETGGEKKEEGKKEETEGEEEGERRESGEKLKTADEEATTEEDVRKNGKMAEDKYEEEKKEEKKRNISRVKESTGVPKIRRKTKEEIRGAIPIGKEKEELQEERLHESDHSVSSSAYSYTYQNESPEELDLTQQRVPYKDIEAQKIRDDVTIQVFNEPLTDQESSSSADQNSCFVIRAKRKRRRKLKAKSVSPPADNRYDSSTSIADTESHSTEEICEERVIHIEVEDSSDKEALLQKGEKWERKKQRGRMKKIIAALSGISWLGKRTNDDKIIREDAPTKKPSLVGKIADMLRTRQPKTAVQIYKRVRTPRGVVETAIEKYSSSSSSSFVEGPEETKELLNRKRSESEGKKKTQETQDLEEISEENLYFKTYDSHRKNRKMAKKNRGREYKIEDDLEYPFQKKFDTKELPRHLKPITQDMAYLEVDEKAAASSGQKCHCKSTINKQTDVKTSPSRENNRHTWNVIQKDEQFTSTTQTPFESTQRESSHSLDMSTIEEKSDEFSKTSNKYEDLRSSDNTEEYIDVTGLSSETSDTKPIRDEEDETLDEGEESPKTSEAEDTAVEYDTETESQIQGEEEKRKVLSEEDTEESKENPKSWTESGPSSELQLPRYESREKLTFEETETEGERSKEDDTEETALIMKKKRKKKTARKTQTERTEQKTEERPKRPDLHDPLAGLELYEAGYKSKSKKRGEMTDDSRNLPEAMPVPGNQEERITKQFERDNGPAKVDKATDLPDKTQQTQVDFSTTIIGSDREEMDDPPIATTAAEHSEEDLYKTDKSYRRGRDSENRTWKRRSPRLGRDAENLTVEEESSRRRGGAEEFKFRRDYTRNEPSETFRRDNRGERFRYPPRENYGRFVSGFRPIMYRGTGDSLSPRYNLPQEGNYERVRNYELRDRKYSPDQLQYSQQRRIVEESQRGAIGYPRSHDFWNRYSYRPDNRYQYDEVPSVYQPERNYPDQIPMYDPARPEFYEPAVMSPRYPRRYPKPNYGISSAFPTHPTRRTRARSPVGRLTKKAEVVDYKRNDFPILKKYLPMYQKPELILELKEHDKMRIIQQREIERRRWEAMQAASGEQVAQPEVRSRRTNDDKTVLHIEESDNEEKLPYQETQAFKEVTHEYRRKTMRKASNDEPIETNASKQSEKENVIISMSRNADNSRELKQLYPPEGRIQRRPSTVSRFADRIASVFKSKKKRTNASSEEDERILQTDETDRETEANQGRTSSRESLNEMSSFLWGGTSYGRYHLNETTTDDDVSDNNKTAR